jgi:hypothetical protein
MAIALGGLLFLPFPTRIAQATRIKFMREDGQPLAGIRVYQQWECYGLWGDGHSSDTSGTTGTVEFPSRAAYGGVATRVVGKALTVIAVHASYGEYVTLEFQLPPGMRAAFEDSRFRKREPFNTSGSYLDRADRNYFPQEKNDVQRITISGDFSQQDHYIEIPVRTGTPNHVLRQTRHRALVARVALRGPGH